MRTLRPALLLAGLLTGSLLAACSPELHGECKTQADCPTDTICSADGLCLAIVADTKDGGPTRTDGGGVASGECASPCTPGSRCVAGQCVADAADVKILMPQPGTLVGPGPLAVLVSASLPEGISVVEVDLLQGNTKVDSRQTAQLVDGAYHVTFDLAKSSIQSGAYSLKAVATSGTRDVPSELTGIVIDKTGPEITIVPPVYPQRQASHPAQGAYLRTDQITVHVTLKDEPAHPSNEPPQLVLPGVAQPLTAVAEGLDKWAFTFDGRLPTFAAADGPLSFEVKASDSLGNQGSKTGSVRMSRVKWQWTKGRGGNLSAAPALRAGLLYVAGEDQFVYALRPDGTQAWEHDTGAEVVGHVTAGDSAIYATLADGRVVAMDPAETSGQRRIFRCPEMAFPGSLFTSATGAALGTTKISKNTPTDEETLFAMSVDGRMRLWRKDAFPVSAGISDVCYRKWDTGVRSGDTEVSIFSDAQGSQSLFFGDGDSEVQKWSVVRDNQGVYDLQEAWTYDAGDKILAPLALGPLPQTYGVLAARQDGVVKAVDLQKSQLSQGNAKVVTGKVHAAPVHANGAAFLLDEGGNVQKLQLSGWQTAWPSRFDGEARSAGAQGSLVLAQDGRIYAPAGPQVVALAADGSAEWRYDTRPQGSGATNLSADQTTPVLACDGTLYVTLNDTAHQGLVVALITDSTTGLAQSGWPKAFHDNRNSSNATRPLTGPGGGCAE